MKQSPTCLPTSWNISLDIISHLIVRFSGTRSGRSQHRRLKRGLKREVCSVKEKSGRNNNGKTPPRETRSLKREPGRSGRRRGPLFFQVPDSLSLADPLLPTVNRIARTGWPKRRAASRLRLRKTSSLFAVAGAIHRPKSRWPLDLVREVSGNGILGLQVWQGAQLESYGLSDGDIILIGLDDPADGAPAFCAINDQVAVGWYERGKAGRVTISPFVKGMPPIATRRSDVQAAFVLKAVVTSFLAKSGPK